jgi:hypothetical protein
MPSAMTTLPSWTAADWTADVAEPFRSDGQFWSSLAASADALVTLAPAAAVAVALALTGQREWILVPFVVPAGLAVRALLIARRSSRRSRDAFESRAAWREAERTAVAKVFLRVLRRSRVSAR